MKPPEILGLLEEAAGTKMYEDKKRKAVATLEKKQLKVDEINKVSGWDVGMGGWVGDGVAGRLQCWGDSAVSLGRMQDVLASAMSMQHMPACLHGLSSPSRSLQVLTEDILPALDKLRQEKVQYMQWQNATKSQEKLMRFCVAYRYVEAEK